MTDIKYRDYPSQSELREAFTYHPDGYLIWKIKKLGVQHGKRAGKENPSPNGYYRIMLNYKSYASHILIWIYHQDHYQKSIDLLEQLKNEELKKAA